jgi:hypothetical protein
MPCEPGRPVSSAPFTFTVDGATMAVAIDADQGSPSATAQPVTVACANLGDDGFVDRVGVNATWATYVADQGGSD